MPDTYLTVADVIKRYGVGERTLIRWRQTGDGPRFVRFGPKKILYQVTELEAWAAGRTFRHRAEEAAVTAKSAARDATATA